MNLLVTGALGHIGSRLIRELSGDQFQEVCLLDNLSTQRYPALFDLPDDVPFRFIEEDIMTSDLESRFQGVDVVIHLAALTDAEGSFRNPEEVERINLEGTELVAKACAATGAKMIFLSTTSVYGVDEGEVDEDCPREQLRPQSPYAESKLNAEFLLRRLGEREGLQFVICRFGTIFGVSPGTRFRTAVDKFVWQACTGRPLTVWTTAMHQKRPYLDLGDAVEALKFIMDKDLFDRRVYNVVTTNTTVRHIVDIISSFVAELSVEYVDAPIMNRLSYTVSNSRFKEHGFSFRGSLEQGIREEVARLHAVRSS